MRRRMLRAAALQACMLLALPLQAADRATPPDLPATELARQAIDQEPGVIEARRAFDASTHGAAALRASPNEWTTRLSAQRRRYDIGANSNEWQAALERTVRVGGKARIDSQLGDTELVIAQARIDEARHEAARALADLWIDTLAAIRLQELLAEQLAFAETNHQAVQSRQRAGDASLLDLNVARADVLEVQRQRSAAVTDEAKARARLRGRFPQLSFAPVPLAEPHELDWQEAQWRERILAESDPLRIAAGQLRKAELTASRSRADRVPDPTFGVFTGSEANRSERIVGLSVSIPLSGTYREARMRQALQETEVARASLERQRSEQESEIAETVLDANGALARWRLSELGLATTRDSARLTQRAYTLGEADLQALLLARRHSLDAATAAVQARVQALRRHYRLLVDAHLIWGLADE